MQLIPTIATAMLLGLLGSVHCVAMCGGIAGALTMAREGTGGNDGRSWLHHACYGVGRVSSYALAGACAGSLGLVLGDVLGPRGAMLLRGAAALLLVLLGLQLGGWWTGLSYLERVGGALWRKVTPVLPVRGERSSLLGSLCIGMVWGWLPCGLVYSTLAWAGTSGDPISAAIAMGAFGSGTLPGVWLVGVGASRFARLTRARGVREIAGAAVIVTALWTLLAAVVAGSGGGASCHDAPVTALSTPSEVHHSVDRHAILGDVFPIDG